MNLRVSLLMASLLAVALAGCTDEPPSGEVSSSAAAIPMAAAVTILETEFNDPTINGDGSTCQARESDPAFNQKCTYPSTQIEIHLTSFPDPSGDSYSINLYSEAAGANQDLGMMNENGTGDALHYTLAFDNTQSCSGSTSDDDCVLGNKFDTIQVLLGDIVVGEGPYGNGAEITPAAGLGPVSFTINYSGKTGTVELNAPANNTYQFLLYEAADDGSLSATSTFSVQPGTNEITAEKNFAAYAQAHVHIAGTKVNLATAGFA